MAIQTWYITQINVGGTAPNRLWYDLDPAAAVTQTTSVSGWTVGKIAASNYADLSNGLEQATGTFSTTVVPNNTAPTVDNSYAATAIYTPPDLLNSTDSICTLYEYNGYFPAGNWVFDFPVIAVSAGGVQDGRIRMRVFKAARSGTAFTGTTELTASASAPLTGSTVTNLTTSAAQTSSITWAAPDFFLNNEFLIIKIGWEITGAGNANNQDVLIRYGSGATMTSPNFRVREYNIT